jgi:hypothetical protein
MELTDKHRRVLAVLDASPTPAAIPSPNRVIWVLNGGARVFGSVVKELEAEGLVDFIRGNDRQEIQVEITNMGRAELSTQAPDATTHQPRRGDAVERWLERRADDIETLSLTIVDLLEEYRDAADAGTPLGE